MAFLDILNIPGLLGTELHSFKRANVYDKLDLGLAGQQRGVLQDRHRAVGWRGLPQTLQRASKRPGSRTAAAPARSVRRHRPRRSRTGRRGGGALHARSSRARDGGARRCGRRRASRSPSRRTAAPATETAYTTLGAILYCPQAKLVLGSLQIANQ